MKHIISFLLAFLLLGSSVALAQKPKSTVRFRLSDGTPLLITINGRDFQKTGSSITISDLPGRRQSVIIYRYRPYTDGKGAKAERVFSGTIKMERGKTYDAVVDVQQRKLRLHQVASLAPTKMPFDPRRDQAISPAEQPSVLATSPPLRPDLDELKQRMDQQTEDSKKLYEAKKYIADQSYTTEEVKLIASWLFFDDTRMVFAKAAYEQVRDPGNYKAVADVFTLPANQEAFLSYLKGKN